MIFDTVYPLNVNVSEIGFIVEGILWAGSLADLSGLLTGLPGGEGVFSSESAVFLVSPRRQVKVSFDGLLPRVTDSEYLQKLKDRVDKVWATYEQAIPAVR